MTSISGIRARLSYGWEATYKAGSSTYDKIFGQGTKVTTNTRNQTPARQYGIGNVEAVSTTLGNYEIAMSVESLLSNGWWLRAVTGNTSVDTGAGPYTHTYVNSAGSPATINKAVQSFETRLGYDMDTDHEFRVLGCFLNNISLSSPVGEPVKMTFDITGASENYSSTLQAVVTETEEPLIFAYGTLELPTGTTLLKVQSVDLTINRNPEGIRALGSRSIQQVANKLSEYEIKFTMSFVDVSILNQFAGSATSGPQNFVSEVATLKLNFNNGRAGTDVRELNLEFGGIRLNEMSIPTPDDAIINQEITAWPRVLTKATYKDNTAVAL